MGASCLSCPACASGEDDKTPTVQIVGVPLSSSKFVEEHAATFVHMEDPGSGRSVPVSSRKLDSKMVGEDAARRACAFTFDNGATYIGEWLGGVRSGRGSQEWPDGARYVGEWATDKAHGRGKFTHADGDVYDGEWCQDKAHGRGRYVHNDADGSTYDGEWVQDHQSGEGVEDWKDGTRYAGHYLDGQKHGYGVFSWNDGSKYMGQFAYNEIHGVGVYIWADGRRYVGQWSQNRMSGKGEFSRLDGKVYKVVGSSSPPSSPAGGPLVAAPNGSGSIASAPPGGSLPATFLGAPPGFAPKFPEVQCTSLPTTEESAENDSANGQPATERRLPITTTDVDKNANAQIESHA